jgi:mannose-1-phosphate guanylyltransferase
LEAEPTKSPFGRADSRSHRWGVILAGGDGRRLLPLTRRINGDDRPKQFSAILTDETPLEQTQRRVSRLVKPWQTMLVLTETHDRFYAAHVATMPPTSLIVQPRNLDTAPAILYALMRLREIDPKGLVAFFPAGHYFSDDDVLLAHIDCALAAAHCHQDLIFLLGITPDSPEVECDWIEPGLPLGDRLPDVVSHVSHFWERPSQTLAAVLMERGSLWDSAVMVGHIQAFLDVMQRTVPPLYDAFEAIRADLFTPAEKTALKTLYSRLLPAAFSREVLAAGTRSIAVLHARGLQWSDLGEPQRALAVANRRNLRVLWASSNGMEECLPRPQSR